MNKKYKAALTSVVFLMVGGLISTSVQSAESHSLELIHEDGETLSPTQEFAMRLKAKNITNPYPDLEYWGVGEIEWGKPKANVSQSFVEGLDGSSMNTKERNGFVDAVQFHFADDLSDREERLVEYRRIRSELITAYGQPSHGYFPETLHGQQDSYVKGINPLYHIEWQGGQTDVSLKLSDDDLVLEFRQSSTSTAKALSEAATTADEIRNPNR